MSVPPDPRPTPPSSYPPDPEYDPDPNLTSKFMDATGLINCYKRFCANLKPVPGLKATPELVYERLVISFNEVLKKREREAEDARVISEATEVNKLKDENARLESKVTKMEQEHQKKHQRQTKTIENREKDNTELRKSNEELNKELEELKSEISAMEQKNQEQADTLEKIEDEKVVLRWDLEESRSKILMVEQEYQQQTENLDRCGDNNRNLWSQNEWLNEELRASESRILEVGLENGEQADAIKRYEKRIIWCQTLINRLKAKIKVLRQENSAVKLECQQQAVILERSRNENTTLQSSNSALESSKSALRSTNSSLETQLNELKWTFSDMKLEYHKQTKTLEDYKNDKETLELRYDQTTKELGESISVVAAMELEFQHRSESFKNCQLLKDQLNEELEGLRTRVSEENQQHIDTIERHEVRAKKLKSLNTKLENENEDLRSTKKQLEGSLRALKQTVLDVGTENYHQARSLEDYKKEKKSSTAEVSVLRLRVSELEKERKQKDDDLKNSTEEVAMFQALKEMLEKELGVLKPNISKLERESKQQANSLKSSQEEMTKLRSSKQQLEKELGELKPKVSKMERENQQQADTLKNSKEEVTEFEKELRELKRKVSQLEQENQQQTGCLKDSKEEAKKLRSSKQQLEKELEELKQKVSNLEKESQQQQADSKEEATKLRSSIKKLEEELRVLRSEDLRLERENKQQANTFEKTKDEAQLSDNALDAGESKPTPKRWFVEAPEKTQLEFIPEAEQEFDLSRKRKKGTTLWLPNKMFKIDNLTLLLLNGRLGAVIGVKKQDNALGSCKSERETPQSPSRLNTEAEVQELTTLIKATTIEGYNRNGVLGSNPAIGAFHTSEIKPNDTIGAFHTSGEKPSDNPPVSTLKAIFFSNEYPEPLALPLGLTSLHTGDIGLFPDIGDFEMNVSSYARNVRSSSFQINIDVSESICGAGCTWLEINPKDPDFQCGSFSTVDQPWNGCWAEYRITFHRRYTKPPQVVVWLKRFSFDSYYWRLYTHIFDITTTGFNISIESSMASKLSFAEVSWVACTADKLGAFSSSVMTPLPSLITPRDKGYVKFREGAFVAPPRVIMAINGIEIINPFDLEISLRTSDITVSGMTWHIDGIESSFPGAVIGASFFALN